jgi:hypothetical protein
MRRRLMVLALRLAWTFGYQPGCCSFHDPNMGEE